MSRLLYRLSYPAVGRYRRHADRTTHVYACGIPSVRGSTEVSDRAPMRNRTADLLLTMETLCRLSYRGRLDPTLQVPPTHQDTHCAEPGANSEAGPEFWPTSHEYTRRHQCSGYGVSS